MAAECKTTMVSARMPSALIARADFVARNTDAEGIKNRSTVLQVALESWLPGQEKRLEDLGVIPKKAR
jgi:hypothetical protein